MTAITEFGDFLRAGFGKNSSHTCSFVDVRVFANKGQGGLGSAAQFTNIGKSKLLISLVP